MLDPDPDEMNADPQPCQKLWGSNSIFSLWTAGKGEDYMQRPLRTR